MSDQPKPAIPCDHCGRSTESDPAADDICGCVVCGKAFCEQCGSQPEGICNACADKMDEQDSMNSGRRRRLEMDGTR
jgi:hypothetical protein